MYPTFSSPATAVRMAAMMGDEAISRARRRRIAAQARDARDEYGRRLARR